MAVVKLAIPFNERLKTAVIPSLARLKLSLFGPGTCEFTVINFRDESIHVVEVRVSGISKKLYTDRSGDVWFGEYILKGRILKVDGKEWGPPNNHYEAVFVDEKPELSNLQFLNYNAL